jgi:tetratricopeptide (TPR) repeat protein
VNDEAGGETVAEGVDEVEEVDDSADPFKRRASLLVVTITLLGALIALWQTEASNRSSTASRQSQQEAITSFQAEAAVSAEMETVYGVYGEDRLLQRQQADARRTQGADAARRLAEVRSAIGKWSPLVSDPRYSVTSDPYFPSKFFAEKYERADRAAIVRAERTEVSEAWGAKADGYVAVISILAVALVLIGLSLTVGTARLAMLLTGVVTALTGVVWAVTIYARSVPVTPKAAIDAVVAGNRASTAYQFDEAVMQFTKAIDLRPDYGRALALRANARIAAATPQDLRGTTLLSIVAKEALGPAIADAEAAYRHGFDKDVSLVGLLGAVLWHDGRFADSLRVTREAVRLNDRLPYLHTNVGVAEAGLGHAREAAQRHDDGIRLNRQEGGPSLARRSFYASGRLVLEKLTQLAPARADLARRLQGQLTAAQMRDELKLPAEPSESAPPGATAEPSELRGDGAAVRGKVTFRGVPTGSPIAFIWYYRSEEAARNDLAWDQPPLMASFATLQLDTYDVTATKEACPVPGHYRLDVHVAGQRVGSQEVVVPPGAVGTMVSESDPLIGVSVCRPTDWKVDRASDFLTLEAPDGLAAFSAGTFPLNSLELTQSSSEIEATATGHLSLGFPTLDSDRRQFGGVEGLLVRYDGGHGIINAVFASVGSDKTLRIVNGLAAPGRLPPLNEILNTLRFLDLPPATPPG